MDRHAVKFAAALSAVEIGLGSLLHGLNVPFRGNALSLNQGFVLSRASFTGAETRARGISLTHTISLTAASLKSLSPVGQKLTPMLAISVQGFLFSLGQLLFGVTWLGHSLGMVLIALWAIAQPILLGWILNGESFLKALDWAIRTFSPEYGYPLVFGLVILELFAGIGLVYLSKKMTAEEWQKFQARLTTYGRRKPGVRKWFLPVSPLTLLSIALTFLFLFFTESPEARTIWIWVRPLGVMLFFAMVIHWVPVERLVPYLKVHAPRIAETLEAVLVELKR